MDKRGSLHFCERTFFGGNCGNIQRQVLSHLCNQITEHSKISLALCSFVSEQNIKRSLLKYMAQNASLQQLQACGFSDIASQLEFQRLVKEKSQADNSSGGDIDIVSLSPSQLTPICRSSYDSRADSSLSGCKQSRKI